MGVLDDLEHLPLWLRARPPRIDRRTFQLTSNHPGWLRHRPQSIPVPGYSQLLSGSGASYVLGQLALGKKPADVAIPGLTGVAYPPARTLAS
jgi:hypothetical protein